MTNLTENHFCNQLVHKQNETIRQPELGGEGRRNPIHAVSWVILQFRQKSAAFLKLEYSRWHIDAFSLISQDIMPIIYIMV